MNFFKAQDAARSRTNKLLVLLVIAVTAIVLSLYGLAIFQPGRDWREVTWWKPKEFFYTTGFTLAVIMGGALIRILELSKGGSAVADSLGARLVSPHTNDQRERRYLNIVQEMALASGLPVPDCYVMDADHTVNAFAAGNEPKDAVIGVTRGALDHLTRDELQGVIGHEFSHIGNGDMKLNIKIIGTIAGLTALAALGYFFVRIGLSSTSNSERKNNLLPLALALAGLLLVVLGWIGILFGRIIQAAVSRQREFLADASSVQFTRNPKGLSTALQKVAKLSEQPRANSVAETEAQHLFFNSSGGLLRFLFSTHPPLSERVKRIDPEFQGELPAPMEGEAEASTESLSAADTVVSGLSAASSVPPPLPQSVPSDLKIQEAVGFRGKIPEQLCIISNEPIGAMAIVLGLILRQDPQLRAKQLSNAGGLANGEVVRLAISLKPLLNDLIPGMRLPLLDLSMPALRHLSKSQVADFRKAIDQVGYDAGDDLIILLIHASMRRHLSVEADVKVQSHLGLSVHCARVLSAVVQTSGESANAQRNAFALGFSVLGLPVPQSENFNLTKVKLSEVEESLAVLALIKIDERRNFVRACGVAMLNDNRAEPAEIEMVRAVGDSLGITFAS